MSNTPDHILIQRCVDGELDSTAETTLLHSLDRQETGTGWRTLALAFLEDRLFRTASLQHLDRTSPVQELPVAASASLVPPRRSNWQLLTGMSLSTLLGVGLGFATMNFTQGPAPVDQSIAVHQPTPIVPTDLATPAMGVSPVLTAEATVGVMPVAEVDLAPLWSSDVPVRVPVFEETDIPLQWLQQPPGRVPANVRARLENQGYLVDEKRQYFVVPLNNGQKALVPQDAVRVRYAVQ